MTKYQKYFNSEKRNASIVCSVIESSPLCPNMGSKRCPRTLVDRGLKEVKEECTLPFGFETECMNAEDAKDGRI